MKYTGRTLATGLASIALLTGLTACSSTPKGESVTIDTISDQRKPVAKETREKPLDLTGTWKQISPPDEKHYFEATITADTIRINWVSNDTKTLYWLGTYTPPFKSSGYSWRSVGDKDKMSDSPIGSQNSTKDFKYANRELTYSSDAKGMITAICLKKQ